MKLASRGLLVCTGLLLNLICGGVGEAAGLVTASNNFTVSLGPPGAPEALEAESLFGINTAFQPDTRDLEARLRAMQQAGIKWGRQDFTWRRIEKVKGQYEWEPYDRLVEQCWRHGLLLFGDLTYNPAFYDMRSAEGIEAYCAFARTAVQRYAGRIDHWQIWNEPNLGSLSDPELYARLLAASGKAIHEANPKAKVLGCNMAFCDVLWAEKILKQVPYDCFDVICFHPYRNPNAPEDKFDWWVLDQYVKVFHKKDLTPEYPLVHMSFLEQTEELIKMMTKFGPPKPIWITEMCFNTHIHPYGVSELREADLLARFYLLALGSTKIEKVFWWTLKDGGPQQFDAAEMVGLMRNDLTPKYAYYAHAVMTRLLAGKKWVRNDSFGPDVYALVFTDHAKGEDLIAAWSPRPFAYVRINNTEKGLTFYDLYGTRRIATYDKVRTGSLPVPLGESPIYVTGPKGLRARVRPDPGW